MKKILSLTILSVIIALVSVLLFRERIAIVDKIATIVASSSSSGLLLLYRYYSTDTSTTSARAIPTLNDNDDNNLQSHKLSVHPSIHLHATAMSIPRAIRKVFLAVEQAEGAGARVRRSVGTPQLKNFSPFLMLDHFSIKPGAGFPDHPHRGQETITYLLSGAVDHEDFAGNKGTIGPGDLQFMTAGRGIIHAEMPAQNADGSANVGLQLWVDLPAKLKACEPRYRDLRAVEIPSVRVDAGRVNVKVISGQSHGIDSVQDLAYTPVWILDVEIQPGGKIAQPLPEGWNAFAYALEGTIVFGPKGNQTTVEQYHNAVFEPSGEVVLAEVDAGAERSGRFVLIAGTPLDQKVVQYGPFVLNSQEEVYQAFIDYQTHTNGFERAKGWESEIGKSMAR
ncbi:RmlC-like cupin domain-containing protein [Podospora appendiculata]|uniref:RmlC-like cupin domain-containing protein n=1 Tax=Podospora appendiculata TaxID=314037 RepID=A0AAE1C996_9PEZI|nr:RmlC-like cupin domain-containing protein [Podospora appendiculata]